MRSAEDEMTLPSPPPTTRHEELGGMKTRATQSNAEN